MNNVKYLGSDYIEVVEKTYLLIKKIADYDVLNKIKTIENKGKRIDMGTSSTLILDSFDSFKELRNLVIVKNNNEVRVAVSLLIRYLHELYINFLYIFDNKKDIVQNRSKAFFYYGDYIKARARDDSEPVHQKREWIKFISKSGSKTSWHGKTFRDISEEVKYKHSIYKVLSFFTHPGIFAMERILDSEMFIGIIDDAIFFTSYSLCDIIYRSNIKKLGGVKRIKNIDNEINELMDIHKSMLDKMIKVRDGGEKDSL